jgi:Rrf2 family protein
MEEISLVKISTKGRYGARAMVELAKGYQGPPMRAAEIAKSQDISLKYLETILAILKSAGLVNSSRGRNGGYSLARRPEEISMYAILSPLEDSINFVHCTGSEVGCDRIEQCVTRAVWVELKFATERILKSHTLDTLVARWEMMSNASRPGEIIGEVS